MSAHTSQVRADFNYMLSYYQKNKEHLKKLSKLYKENHKEQIKERNRIYRINNKEKARLYKENHKEQIKKRYVLNKNNIDWMYKKYEKSAKERNLEWELTTEQFKSFWQKPCYYCSYEIQTIGLDRIDNKKGYLLDNLVVCCGMCNKMKGTFTQKEFLKQCNKIYTTNLSKL